MSTDRKPPEPFRTVSDTSRGRMNGEMHAFGLLYAAVLAIVVVPLLPFAAVVWLATTVAGAIRGLGSAPTEDRVGSGRRRGN